MSVDPRIYVSLRELMALRVRARQFSFLPRQPIASVLSGRHASRLRGRGLSFEELRRYRLGDDIRTMDWRVTQRTGKPHVRVHTEEKERQVYLCVDQRSSMFFGSQERLKSVTAAQVAALAVWRVLADNDRVGALVFNDTEHTVLRPQRSQSQVVQILGKVAELNNRLEASAPLAGAASQLNHTLNELHRLNSHDGLIILISDWYGYNDETFALCRKLSQHNDLVNILVQDPLEQSLSDMGQFVASNGTLQLEVDPAAEQLGAAYAAAHRNKVSVLQQELRRLKAPLLPIDTCSPVTEQLMRALGHAGGV